MHLAEQLEQLVEEQLVEEQLVEERQEAPEDLTHAGDRGTTMLRGPLATRFNSLNVSVALKACFGPSI